MRLCNITDVGQKTINLMFANIIITIVLHADWGEDDSGD